MGRTLEALRQADVRRTPPSEPAGLIRPFADPTDEPEATIPFVEVGGPRPATAPCSRPGAPAPAAYPVLFHPLPPPREGRPPAGERFAPELVTYHQPDHAVSGQYRLLCDGLMAQQPANRAQVLLFSGPAPGVGTTTVLLNVAVTIARQSRQRVVVVDANWARPAVAPRLGLPAAPGLREVLGWSVPLTQAVQDTGQANLAALTAGSDGAGRDVRLVGEPMWGVLRQLRDRFDLVLVDAPCWDGRPEVVALGSACDAVYLVLRQADAETPRTQELVSGLPRQGSPFRGCIWTQPA
jgi:Mrp family chromosome partitioning ATPase